MLSGGHFLASHDLTTEGSPALTELIDLEAQRRRIDHRQAVLLTEVAASGVCDIEHGHTTPMWLADRTQQSPHACRSRMNTAARLHRRYPQLAEALKTGRVGWQHVKVIDSAGNDRNWQDLADLLPGLIDLAQVATFERWAREVRGIAQRLDQDGGYDPASDPANNHLHLVPTTDGITYVSGQLVGELALTIKKLIDGETERVLKRYRADAEATGGETPVPSRAQACAEALGELVDRGSGVPEGSGKLPEPEIVVILNDTGDTEDGGELTDDDGNHLSPHILRFIIAAAMIRPLEVSGSGDPLRMGRTLRYANRHQRRALLARDGGCIFPGCDRPASWCDVHHVDEWDANGPTDIDNIGLLCRHHHRVTHRPGWTMTPTALPSDPNTTHSNGVRFRWRTPTGRLIDSQRHHQRSHPSAA
ncbi:MAG: DUF222 domain-containing protein [Candidatus Microthrix subdominans]|jgi:hypothetical protein|uniref:HNH endonuclease signature motif containing protein n=1 Tax=Candidatus Neomicrothrix sp. TaxID=2719034 RepID=UPI001B7CBFA1|nr:HNH endonuclease signature motif containing protein [Candidatus Microthrix sp.]MBK6311101.1 DUF222 domain-containing protein [Candidatus Microthrix sp.]MBK6440399.1 DUF222 domain-containing protein [Candidatus Microthrix sp.]MBK6971227.1 DUF222 domain-containing protein [Candidatus Microthrix sp.]MBK9559008.1 DUF222 domain-containing protein [Candidatus Microthrix sp.]MBP7594659.1 DUF222 domain-containing protein [Candidatus Microthrix sp.]